MLFKFYFPTVLHKSKLDNKVINIKVSPLCPNTESVSIIEINVLRCNCRFWFCLCILYVLSVTPMPVRYKRHLFR